MALGDIPNNVRVPLVYLQIDNSGALSGNIAQDQQVLLMGQMLDTGTATPLAVIELPTSPSAIDALFGAGSMLALAAKRYRKANSYTQTFVLPHADLTSGAAAAGSIKLTGPATAAGTLYLLIAGQSLQVGVTAADTAAAMATATAAAINAASQLPVIAAVDGTDTAKVKVTAKWKGTSGNDLDLRINYYSGEQLPVGVGVTFEQPSSGSGTPDMAAMMAAIPNEWYNHWFCGWNDTQVLNTLREELLERWGPFQMIEAIAYAGFRGTYAESITFGKARNDFLLSCMASGKMPTPPWELAASYCGRASYALAIDPARPLQTLELTGALPPAKADRFAWTERNNLLANGMATYQIQSGDIVAIEREVSMYQRNAYGDDDPSYLDITTPATLGKIRYDIKVMVTNRFPRHKLADDDVLALIDPAQPIVTPKIMRAAIIDVAEGWVEQGLLENFELFKSTLSVYRDKADRNRLNIVCHPDVVNQLRAVAGLIQFVL